MAMYFLIDHKREIENKIAFRLLHLFNQDLKICFISFQMTVLFEHRLKSLKLGSVKSFIKKMKD